MFEGSAFTTPTGLKETTGLVTLVYIEVCGLSISATQPVPYSMMLTRTRPVPKIATRPDPTAGIPIPVAYP